MRGLSLLARGSAKLSHFGPVMGQSGVCETVRAMSNDTAPTTMPIPQNGTVLPRPVPQAQRRPRECLTLKEVERLIAAARQNRYGPRDATMIRPTGVPTHGVGANIHGLGHHPAELFHARPHHTRPPRKARRG
jgi:hypothetical protein